jgi:PadR family transcriptional regulator, regulatory protein PadR
MTDPAAPRPPFQRTAAARAVLIALRRLPADGWMYGRELLEATRLPSGSLHPLLARLAEAGWVERRWEGDQDEGRAGPPRRRYYRLTDTGRAGLRAADIQAWLRR